MAEFRESSREPQTQTARRAEVVSLWGLALQLVFFGCMLLWALWNGSYATYVSAFFLLGGVIIWSAILLIYHQQKLVELEALEAEQIDRDREAIGAEALFAEGRAEIDGLLVARGRLEWMRRWLVPMLGLAAAVYLIAMGASLSYWVLPSWGTIGDIEWPQVTNASVTLGLVGGVAFLSFLFSRYTVGMARIGEMWRMMRAGGSYLAGSALVCGLTAGMLGFAAYGKATPEQVFACIVPILMCVIGAELLVNLLLDIYRPRQVGEIPRPAFDSRLLGLISEPGGVARTIADAVNYQFGFEVSKTWFYQLLERWALVLVGAAVVVLFGMSCLVIVEPGERAVVERFGSPLGLSDASIRPLEPGLNLKLPWPIDCVTRYRVDHVESFRLGFGAWKRRNPPEVKEVPRLVLWTNPVHGPGEELDFVLPVRPEDTVARVTSRPATTQGAVGEEPGTPAVNLVRASVPVMYRVNDLYKFAFNYANPETLIESAAYGELVKYVASRDLDQLLAVERRQISEDLTRLIQARCDEMRVGVEVIFVGVEDIHPPQKAAKQFEAYLNAKYERGAAIAKAEGEANKILSEVAGTRERAERLAKAIDHAQQLISDGAPEADMAKAYARVEELFAGTADGLPGVSGEAAETVAIARAIRWSEENQARARAVGFRKKLAPYRAAPRLYKTREIVEALTTGLFDAKKKFVIAREGDVFTRYEAIERERVQLEDIDYNVPPG